jgi:hypothetical protein
MDTGRKLFEQWAVDRCREQLRGWACTGKPLTAFTAPPAKCARAVATVCNKAHTCTDHKCRPLLSILFMMASRSRSIAASDFPTHHLIPSEHVPSAGKVKAEAYLIASLISTGTTVVSAKGSGLSRLSSVKPTLSSSSAKQARGVTAQRKEACATSLHIASSST